MRRSGRATPVPILVTSSREPLKLAAGHFGLGHGSGAHAPDEYHIIESRTQIQTSTGRRCLVLRTCTNRRSNRERMRLACWRARPAIARLFCGSASPSPQSRSREDISQRRRNQHAKRDTPGTSRQHQLRSRLSARLLKRRRPGRSSWSARSARGILLRQYPDLGFSFEIDRRDLWTAPTISSFTVAVVLIRFAG